MRNVLLLLLLSSSSGQAQVFSSKVEVSPEGALTRVSVLHCDTTVELARIFGSEPEGAEVYFHANGNARLAFISTMDSRDRIRIEWYSNGLRESERVDRGEGNRGYAKYWYDDGQLRFWAELLNGKPHGQVREWSPDNALIRDEVYRNGKLRKARIRGPKL